jgi:hypothetical protein
VDERGRLDRVFGTLTSEVALRESTQVGVHDGNQALESLLASAAPLGKESCHVGRWALLHACGDEGKHTVAPANTQMGLAPMGRGFRVSK